jgi:hypothetical protein
MRRLSILALSAILGVGCGGSDTPPATPIRAACSVREGTITGPTLRLTYEADQPVGDDVPVLCERLRASQSRYRIRRVGEKRLVIELPATSPHLAQTTDLLGSVGQVSYYDWEVNVIGPDGRTDPTSAAVTGGQSAGSVGAIPLYDAILRASAQPQRASARNSRTGSAFYAVDPTTSKVFQNAGRPNGDPAEETLADARANVPPALRVTAKVYEVKQGTVIIRAEQPDAAAKKSDQWYVLRDQVALTGAEIRNPEQQIDQVPGGSDQPIVTFDFTSKGRKIWRTLTRRIAERGSESVGLLPGQDPSSANQHFAIVLDDELVSTPFIDFRQNPDGIDGRTGSQISGGFTIKSAQTLASLLKTGPVPVPLVLISSTAPAVPAPAAPQASTPVHTASTPTRTQTSDKSRCLRGRKASDELPDDWLADGHGVDEFYADDCFASEQYLRWLENDADPSVQLLGRVQRATGECLRAAGFGGLDLIPPNVSARCEAETRRVAGR